MKPDAVPNNRGPFRLSKVEQDGLKLFVAKKLKKDYRYVNSQSIVPKIPIPPIDELFDQRYGCTIFSVIGLAQEYHQMRIVFQRRKYTTFRTHAETYQWCVTPVAEIE
ncbi:Retrotransposon protein [Phytophthora megakarya]|uniref:Retrotransposon protein n=1 Tax=Phytophthora megakarya TaxID=4795 RepID=A0A225W4A3_9STRA|nr:Retrotransposon protein [Phytophthora megakarya]